MKKIFLLLTLLPCFVYGEYYVGLFGGANWITLSHLTPKIGYVVGGSIGYDWECHLRTELEFAYRNNEVKGGICHPCQNTRCYSALFNFLFDSGYCIYSFSPFLGAGVGVATARLQQRYCEAQERNASFAWQLIAGIKYPVFCSSSLELSYRYFNKYHDKLNNHSLVLGLNYGF